MGNRLIHFHGLLANQNNFKEQMEVNMRVPQYAINYWPFVEGKGKNLINNLVVKTIGVLEKKPNGKLILHGNSAGGFLAVLVASHPDMYQKIAGVVLNCSAGLAENLASGDSGATFGFLEAIRNDKSQIAPLIQLFVQLPKEKIPQRLINEIKTLVLGENCREQLAQIVRRGQLFKKETDLVSASFREGLVVLVKQGIPTLVIGGTNDLITPKAVIDEMADILGTSPVFLRAGHAPHIEEPCLFNKELQKFIDML